MHITKKLNFQTKLLLFMPLWNKGSKKINEVIQNYCVGNDYELDLELVKYDCIGSIAHCQGLLQAQIINQQEFVDLNSGLQEIIELSAQSKFAINQSQEDCHTAIEVYLTTKLGEVGQKIHTGRSRNDQVLTAIRLYEKDKILEVLGLVNEFIETLSSFEIKFGPIQIPGFTHTRKAMPSSISLWSRMWIASMKDNLTILNAAFEIINQSPLGSAAGYGLPEILQINRDLTSSTMGFNKPQEILYCQHSRGKFESTVIHTLSQVMFDLNRLASDLIMFSEDSFGIFILPKEFCTGSSIMPQKFNQDCLELMRAKYHQVVAFEFQLKSMTSNLISGYHRDLQLTKEPIIKSFGIVLSSLIVATEVFKGLSVNEVKAKEMMAPELFATDDAYKLVVNNNIPFRKAYQIIGDRFV
jgi:argininosuccinate lyase